MKGAALTNLRVQVEVPSHKPALWSHEISSRPRPKLRLLKWVNPGVGLGVRWFRWWLFWLRGDGEGDGGVEEVECAALVGGGFGEHGHLDGGAVVAELVAGEGGQVIE